jgi:hypothetical protein
VLAPQRVLIPPSFSIGGRRPNGISRSAAVRMLIEAGLVDFAAKAADTKPRRPAKK